jgi:hypothetical protein
MLFKLLVNEENVAIVIKGSDIPILDKLHN